MTPRVYLLQRGTALIMAPMVLVHLVTIIIAVRGGLSAGDILARTQGSAVWAGFYTLFVVAAAVHAGIGLQVIAREWLHLAPRPATILGHAFLGITLLLGLRAVYAVAVA